MGRWATLTAPAIPQDSMSKPAQERRTAASWSSLEPYAQLLRALLPRLTDLAVFNARGELHWAGAMAVGPDLSQAVVASLETAASTPDSQGEVHTSGGEPAYL